MRRIAAAVAALALTGCTSHDGPASTPTPKPVAIVGSLVLNSPGVQRGSTGDPCWVSTKGYQDIREGAQVTVTDGAGAVIALGSLGPGKIGKTTTAGSQTIGLDCTFPFTVEVPERDFYGVEVARRGVVRYARADIGAPIAMTLG